MKIAISSTGDNLFARIEPRFEKTKHFLILDMSSLKDFKSLPNPAVEEPGSGVTAEVNLLIENRIDVLVTGKCTMAAKKQLESAHIRIYDGYYGNILPLLNNMKSYQKRIHSRQQAEEEPRIFAQF
ncbi:MAG: NifB/NifX family molybdenum-iron cluster-binding protein [Calditrichia bacterium]